MMRSSDGKPSSPWIGSVYNNENGAALIIGLMFLAIIAMAGSTAVILTSTDLQIGGNYKTSVQAFNSAQAGLEETRQRLKGTSSTPNFVGDPSSTPQLLWSAYIRTDSSWEASDDPNYNSNYQNNMHESLQTDNPYFVKIKHKTEYDAIQAGHTASNPHYYDGDGDTATTGIDADNPGSIIYYGYGNPSAPSVAGQFTISGTADAWPVEIISAYGTELNAMKELKSEVRRPIPPNIISAVYGNVVGGNGNVTVNGNDNCAQESSVPPISYFTSDTLSGSGSVALTRQDPPTPTSLQLSEALDVQEMVAEIAKNSLATVTLTSDQQNVIVGDSSNYEIVYCDATTLSPDQELDINNIQGYGILAINGDAHFAGSLSWHGIILCSGNVDFQGGGTRTIYGALLSHTTAALDGTVNIYYDSCDIEKAKQGFNNSFTVLVWRDTAIR